MAVKQNAENWRESWLIALGKLENSLLAAWISGPSLRDRWTPVASEFGDVRTRAIAGACAAVAARGAGLLPGAEVVAELSRSGDLKKLWAIGDSVLPETPSRDPDGDLVRWRDLRTLFALHHRLVELVSGLTPTSPLPPVREAILEALASSRVGGPMASTSLEHGLLSGYEVVTRQDMAGAFTGITELDQATGGLRHGHVWVIGAPTSWGKSGMLLALADRYLSVHTSGVLIVTCEDDPELFFTRWLARRARLNGKRARDARLLPDELDRAAEAVKQAGANGPSPVMLDGRGRSVEEIADAIRGHVSTHGIRLVLVDYLQCITTERQTQDRRGEINHIARTLTDAIKTSGASGVLASQLTGEDIRESRDVEHAAEVVLIGRKSEETGERSMFLKKNKTGPSGIVIHLAWDDSIGTFEDERQTNDYTGWIPDYPSA